MTQLIRLFGEDSSSLVRMKVVKKKNRDESTVYAAWHSDITAV